MKSTCLFCLLFLTANVFSATYYLDAVNGNDLTGDGSQALPWQSIDGSWASFSAGDTVILASGNYGEFHKSVTGGADPIFTDWVTFKADDGASVQIEDLEIRYHGTAPADPGQYGTYDAYIRLEGIHILDGVETYNARHLALVDCLIERYGPWTGTVDDIEKTAIMFRSGTDILIQDCEITNSGVAIAGRGHDVRILNGYFHDCSHDGIRVNGFWDSLIEGNTICRFDDGVTDSEASWSRHCDLIHIFIPGPAPDGWQNHNVVIRNNRLFDTEAQTMQFNNYYASDIRNEQILIENNVFGPSNANLINNADPTDGLIIRSNTMVVLDQPRQFNRWTLDNYIVRIGSESTGVQIYNNLLGACAPPSTAEVLLFDWNLIQIQPSTIPTANETGRVFGRFIYDGLDPKFVNPTDFTGEIAADSDVIDLGTRLNAPTPIYDYGINGVLRDNRPDLGAWEVAGRTPEVEPVPNDYNDEKTVFLDDFEDGDYVGIDPWLNDVNTQGMSWHNPESAEYVYNIVTLFSAGTNMIQEPLGIDNITPKPSWLLADQGDNWADYDFSFNASNAYVALGSGVMLLAQDTDNYYWLDISRDNGRLMRYIDGVESELARDADIELPHSGLREYKVSVRHEEGGDITISCDADDDGTEDFSFTDSDSQAIATFASGKVGFHCDYAAQYLKVSYDDVRVDVLAKTDSDNHPGDANGDGKVNLDDFITLKQNYGSNNASWSQGDFNSDGMVNLDDFIILKQNYGYEE